VLWRKEICSSYFIAQNQSPLPSAGWRSFKNRLDMDCVKLCVIRRDRQARKMRAARLTFRMMHLQIYKMQLRMNYRIASNNYDGLNKLTIRGLQHLVPKIGMRNYRIGRDTTRVVETVHLYQTTS
jgi:hypothetical protein